MSVNDLQKIAKKGRTVSFATPNYEGKRGEDKIKALKKRRHQALKREDVDWDKLSKFVIKLH
jgi:hypothetical protein